MQVLGCSYLNGRSAKRKANSERIECKDATRACKSVKEDAILTKTIHREILLVIALRKVFC